MKAIKRRERLVGVLGHQLEPPELYQSASFAAAVARTASGEGCSGGGGRFESSCLRDPNSIASAPPVGGEGRLLGACIAIDIAIDNDPLSKSW
jgi:hypothetical protein